MLPFNILEVTSWVGIGRKQFLQAMSRNLCNISRWVTCSKGMGQKGVPLWVQFAMLQVQRLQSSLPNSFQQSIVKVGLGSLGQEQQSLRMVQVSFSHIALVTGQNLHQHFAHRNITMLTIFGSWPTTDCCYTINAFQGLGDLDPCLVKLNAVPGQTNQFGVA